MQTYCKKIFLDADTQNQENDDIRFLFRNHFYIIVNILS